MTPKQAIEKLHSRLLSYANKHSANYDYIKDTTDIVNALIDLYNDNEQCHKSIKLMERKINKIADFVGFNPELMQVEESLLDYYLHNIPVPNMFIEVAGEEEACEAAVELREQLLLWRHKRILGLIDIDRQMRAMLHIDGMEELLTVPAYVEESDMYNYILKQYVNEENRNSGETGTFKR